MKTKTVSIGEGLANIQVPEAYTSDVDDENTVQVYPPGQEDIILRFTALTLTPPDKAVRDGGNQFVANDAEEADCELSWLDDERCLYETEEDSDEEGDDTRFIFWHLGYGNSVFIISADIDDEHSEAPHVVECLERVPEIIQSIIFAPAERRAVVDGPRESLEAESGDTSEESAAEISEIDPESAAWIEETLELAATICTQYAQDAVSEPFDPRNLDAVFERWLADSSPQAADDNTLGEALGAAFGSYLCKRLAMRWVIVTDEGGASIAVRCESPCVAMEFPIDRVMKHVESGEANFFENAALALQRETEGERT